MSIKPQEGKLYSNLCCQNHMAEVLSFAPSINSITIRCQNEQCPKQSDESYFTQSLILEEFTIRYRSGLVGTWGVFDPSDHDWSIGFDGDLLTFDTKADAQDFCALVGCGYEPRKITEACIHPAAIHVHTYYSHRLAKPVEISRCEQGCQRLFRKVTLVSGITVEVKPGATEIEIPEAYR